MRSSGDFGRAVDGAARTEICLALAGDRPFGLIERYPTADTPEYEPDNPTDSRDHTIYAIHARPGMTPALVRRASTRRKEPA